MCCYMSFNAGPRPVETMIDGVLYHGTYTARDGVLTVGCALGSLTGTAEPSQTVPLAARILLRDIVVAAEDCEL